MDNMTNIPKSAETPAERIRRILAEKKAASSTSSANSTGLQADPYQDRAVELAITGKSFIVTGPAGSGKSTTLKRIIQALIDNGSAGILHAAGHKYLPSTGTPGVVITSFTNKAIQNDKRILGASLASNCVTHHKLLEYEPVDAENDVGKRILRFEPKRTRHYPLPSSIRTLVIEEATLTNVPLWNTLFDAIPNPEELQLILVGDIQQLPPVFGKSIFIHAMQKGMEIVELKNVWRQAMLSPIISLAHRILSGKIIPAPELPEWNKTTEHGTVKFRTWPKKLSDLQAIVAMKDWIPRQIDSGYYDPQTDIILTPFNKSFGTIVFNNIVAGHLAKKLNAEVWEIFAGFNKKYFRVGEKVIYNKEEATILKIEKNPDYYGKSPRKPSNTMDYDGVEHDKTKLGAELSDDALAEELTSIDAMFEHMASHVDEDSPTSRAASHKITLKIEGYDQEKVLSGAGEIGNLDLAYATTVHKSQGSEWRKVLLLTHNSQSIMLFRELLYTAVTRAREELYIIGETNLFVQGITTQRLPGKTLEEKIAKFDSYIKAVSRNGAGNIDEVPVGLDNFISEKE